MVTLIIWNPVEVGLTAQLEKFQRRFSQCIFPDPPSYYDNKLRETSLVSLQTRRLASDLTFASKGIHRLVDCDHHEFVIIKREKKKRC